MRAQDGTSKPLRKRSSLITWSARLQFSATRGFSLSNALRPVLFTTSFSHAFRDYILALFKGEPCGGGFLPKFPLRFHIRTLPYGLLTSLSLKPATTIYPLFELLDIPTEMLMQVLSLLPG